MLVAVAVAVVMLVGGMAVRPGTPFPAPIPPCRRPQTYRGPGVRNTLLRMK